MLIISERIEVIKDEHYQPLEDSVIVSVLTCAAPNIYRGMEGMSDEEYYDMLKGRIAGMLRAAAYKGYRRLVLGAFGCGAFRNDARIVARAFYEVFRDFRFCDLTMDQLFLSVDFAVLCRSDTYNYDVFSSYFKGE